MKLEFLKNITEYNEHAVRLFDFNSLQAKEFRQAINELIANHEDHIDLTSLGFIQPINCKLTLRVGESDEGISTVDDHNFFCDLTINNYKDMIQLVEPFCRRESSGYQWLYDIDTPIDFLFSAGKEMPEVGVPDDQYK
ncbi:MAG: hypothetical protein HYU69_09260 [Bacteroidetes bacterium]|nr:hypothetical protein [Bacteroidota bacterium]